MSLPNFYKAFADDNSVGDTDAEGGSVAVRVVLLHLLSIFTCPCQREPEIAGSLSCS